MKFISNNSKETRTIAEDLVSKLIPTQTAMVIGLYGNLGAGKTTFVQALAKTLGVEDRVASPTFVIEKIYPIRTNGRGRPTSNGASEFTHLIHIDAYRIEKSDELLHLGWNEIISDRKNLVVVEWADRIRDIMPQHIKISLKPLENESSREIEIVL